MKNYGIETLRVVGLLGVVIIHTNSLGFFGESTVFGYLCDEASRFAVPCFFLISGFLWRSERIADVRQSSILISKKVGLLFVLWTAFYLASEFSGLYPKVFQWNSLVYLMIPFTGAPGYHLWFLPALILGSIVSWCFLRIWGSRKAIWVSAALYIFGISIGAYGPLFGINMQTFLYRNGLFEAPMLLLSGYLMQSTKTYLSKKYFVLAASAGLMIHILEGVISGRFPSGHDYSFGTLLLAIGVFGVFRELPISVGRWGADVLGAYLIHFFILKILSPQLGFSGIVPAITVAFGVTLISLAISRGLKWYAPTRFLVTL